MYIEMKDFLKDANFCLFYEGKIGRNPRHSLEKNIFRGGSGIDKNLGFFVYSHYTTCGCVCRPRGLREEPPYFLKTPASRLRRALVSKDLSKPIYAGMHTSIYIDGLNLQLGGLKGSQYEYRLNIRKFCQNLLPHNHIVQINYFISRPLGGGRDHKKLRSYNSYIQALEKMPEVNVVTGIHKWREKTGRDIRNPRNIVTIKAPEEKCSDVNLAVHLIDDACQDKFECAIVISNDIDMLGAMKMLRKRYPSKTLGLITPKDQRISEELTEFPHFIKKN